LTINLQACSFISCIFQKYIIVLLIVPSAEFSHKKNVVYFDATNSTDIFNNYYTFTHVYVFISGPSSPTAALLPNSIREIQFSMNVSSADTHFNSFFFTYCLKRNTTNCLNKTVYTLVNGVYAVVEITNLTAATFYDVSVYKMLSNGMLSTPALIAGRTGSLYKLCVFRFLDSTIHK